MIDDAFDDLSGYGRDSTSIARGDLSVNICLTHSMIESEFEYSRATFLQCRGNLTLENATFSDKWAAFVSAMLTRSHQHQRSLIQSLFTPFTSPY